ncbi:MAG: hydroxyethylthiazole kinase [Bacteroidales bacterium]|nr:hydroxyethylthiazole kinase [Bacteroidales bacterium]
MLTRIFQSLREHSPLVHCITNYVTVNDCANMLLACGASPVMADDMREVEDIQSIASALVINIGTLNPMTVPAMFKAVKKANDMMHPVVFDPVGAGASNLRTETALQLLNESYFSVIRGNISEIKALALGSGDTQGVDANQSDKVTADNLEATIAFAKNFASRTDAVIAITGAIDIVADAHRAFCIYNGDAAMSRITGTGCQLSALIAAFLAANPEEDFLEVTLAAVCAMGLCGEIAKARLSEQDGNATYRHYIIDAMYHLQAETLEKGAKYEVR